MLASANAIARSERGDMQSKRPALLPW